MAVATHTPAHEAHRLFFEIGMRERSRYGRELAGLGLTFQLAHALRLIGDEPRSMKELADMLVCDASNVTGIADRLEARGLVERRPGEGDRRVKVLALTPAGEELHAQVLAIMLEPPQAIASLSRRDQEALRDILQRALDVIPAYPEGMSPDYIATLPWVSGYQAVNAISPTVLLGDFIYNNQEFGQIVITHFQDSLVNNVPVEEAMGAAQVELEALSQRLSV